MADDLRGPADEATRGRVALRLDPAYLRWLSTHCSCPPDAMAEQRERCGRIRFRARAALHKAGLTSEPPAGASAD